MLMYLIIYFAGTFDSLLTDGHVELNYTDHVNCCLQIILGLCYDIERVTLLQQTTQAQ